jgi:hypothetical protein
VSATPVLNTTSDIIGQSMALDLVYKLTSILPSVVILRMLLSRLANSSEFTVPKFCYAVLRRIVQFDESQRFHDIRAVIP